MKGDLSLHNQKPNSSNFCHFLITEMKEGSNSKANAVTKPGLSKVASHNWIIDSGATDHITSSSKLLHKNKNCPLPPILLPSGAIENFYF